jgi:hypothetical protein
MSDWRPISEFDMALVHDKPNDKVIERKPARIEPDSDAGS